MGIKELKIQLDYHERIVEGLKETIAFLEAKEEKDLITYDEVIGFNYKTKMIYVSEFTKDLIKYKKLGWTIQKNIF